MKSHCAVITDSPRSPAAAIARWNLCARTHNMVFTNSVTGIVMVLDALATQLAERYRAHTLKAFAHTTNAMAEVTEGEGED
jgi:DNA-binding MurR/RpiR family transcriptional regulator